MSSSLSFSRRSFVKQAGTLGALALVGIIKKPTAAQAQEFETRLETEEYETGLMIATMSFDELVTYVAINEDGYWGQGTSALLAKVLNAPFNMYIYHQYYATIQANSALTSGWHCGRTLAGDPLIKKMQYYMNTTQDGVFCTNDIRALQRRMGTYVDGVLSGPSPCVRAMQKLLNAGTF